MIPAAPSPSISPGTNIVVRAQKHFATAKWSCYVPGVMETPVSFAPFAPFAPPLAARLAAQAAKIRPADGARVDVAMIMALFVCALLEMLICV